MSGYLLTLPVSPPSPSSPWLVTFLLAFGLLAWIRYNYPGRWNKTIQSTFNVRMTKQFMREESLFSHKSSAVFLFLFCVAVGLVLYLLVYNFIPNALGTISPFYLIGGILLLSVAHWGLHVLAALLMKEKEVINEYLFTISLIHRTAVLVLLPLAFIVAYTGEKTRKIFLFLSLIALAAIIVYRIIRGLRAVLEVKTSGFYFILYLCALEILPLLLLGKGLMDFNS